MAKKKHNKKKGGGRRRVSGLPSKSSMSHTGQQLIGLVVGSVATKVVQNRLPNLNAKLVDGILIGIGVIGIHKTKHPIIQGISWGMAGAGAVGLAKATRLISGVDDLMSGILDGGSDMSGSGQFFEREISGLSNADVVSGLGGLSNADLVSGVGDNGMMEGNF